MIEKIRLFHGSKSGIKGKISPISRSLCDFGQGFYMGTEKEQPMTLICNYVFADEMCRKYRREGKYFDELIRE